MAPRPRSAALLTLLTAITLTNLYLAFWPSRASAAPDGDGMAVLSTDNGGSSEPPTNSQIPPPSLAPVALGVPAGAPTLPASRSSTSLPDPAALWHSFTYTLAELNGTELQECRRKQRGRVVQYGEVTGITPVHRFWLNTDLTRFKPCGMGPAQEPVLLDIGGDAYWIRLLSNKRMGCQRNRLVVWEPNPHAMRELETKREELAPHFREVVLVGKAVSNVTGEAAFYFNGPTGTGSGGSLTEGAQAARLHPDHPHVTVQVTTVDATLASLQVEYVPMMKIAARGYEYHVLQGAVRTLERTHTVWFECNHHLRANLGAVVHFLEEKGFLTFKAAHGGLLKLYGLYWEDFYHLHPGDHHCLAIRRGSPLLPNVGIACNNK
eukprot:GGOE01017893.1.p1 GENE.GGOE01017893.1~~GGOE01017893.1.p1  ORF type:complete len:378 (+),score=83.69 GGOE01017893.1:98-1231(+)